MGSLHGNVTVIYYW